MSKKNTKQENWHRTARLALTAFITSYLTSAGFGLLLDRSDCIDIVCIVGGLCQVVVWVLVCDGGWMSGGGSRNSSCHDPAAVRSHLSSTVTKHKAVPSAAWANNKTNTHSAVLMGYLLSKGGK